MLGSAEVDRTAAELTSQQASLVVYLATVGPASRETLIEALWDGRPVSLGRFANVVSAARQALGCGHLPEATRGLYRLDGVMTDIDLLASLSGIEVTDQLDRQAPALDRALDRAVDLVDDLVRGPVLCAPRDRYWTWVDHHPEVVGGAEAMVSGVVLGLASTLIEIGDLDRARVTCERGLACTPLDRDLVLALEAVHLAQGRPGSAHRLMESWRARVRRLSGSDHLLFEARVGWWERPAGGPQPATGTAVTTTLPL